MLRVALAILCAGAGLARADDRAGVYYEESGGLAVSRGGTQPYLGHTLYLRLGLGVRLGSFAIEPWIAGSLDTSRDGAQFGLFGGDPHAGGADLATYGVDLKYLHAILPHVELYARGGPLYASGTGMLGPYAGVGLGAGVGLQVVGKVRALGFLFVPLFFAKKGPMVTGALFFDEGVELVHLSADNMPGLSSRTAHANIGFAIGTAF